MRLKRTTLLLALLTILSGACSRADAPMEVKTITITGTDGITHDFTVEIADDEQERQRGLMGRQELAANQGMLFIFPKEDTKTFWMKNTPLFLDMIFIDGAGTVVDIHPLAKPFDERLIQSSAPAMMALEIKGGEAKRQNITVGATISR